MLRLWLHISSRWFVIFCLTLVCSLSGLVQSVEGEQLFLRNNSHLSHNGRMVKGAASQSTHSTFVNSQVQELAIGSKKYSAPMPTPAQTKKWGESEQIDEHTWTIQVGQDESTANSQEVFSA